MFCVTPAGENRMYVSYTNEDRDKMKIMSGLSVGDITLTQVYACDVLEDVLNRHISKGEPNGKTEAVSRVE